MNRPLIAITGKAGAGKDTAAQVIARRFGFSKHAFANAIRREAAEAWRVPETMFTDRGAKEAPHPALSAGRCINPIFRSWAAYQSHILGQARSPRWVMQQWGDFRRSEDPTYWLRAMDRALAAETAAGIVITDLRTKREEAWLRAAGGQILRVLSPRQSPVVLDHHTEDVHLIAADAHISNDGSLLDLERTATAAADHLLSAWRATDADAGTSTSTV